LEGQLELSVVENGESPANDDGVQRDASGEAQEPCRGRDMYCAATRQTLASARAVAERRGRERPHGGGARGAGLTLEHLWCGDRCGK
jgi:hypothetical protein